MKFYITAALPCTPIGFEPVSRRPALSQELPLRPRFRLQDLNAFRNIPRKETLMSRRLDKSWTVFVSVENSEHDRCVDIFSRSDGSYGFEEFRRDIEDGGQWTPVQYYSGASYGSSAQALDTAERCVPWLVDVLAQKPELRRRIDLG
jgi:hypothetical protein